MRSIAKNAVEMVHSMYHFIKHMFPFANFYFYKTQIRLKMEYRCAAHSSLCKPKSFSTFMGLMNYFPPCNDFSTDKTWYVFKRSIFNNLRITKISFVFHWWDESSIPVAFSHELLLYWAEFQEDASSLTTILIFSSPGPTVFPTFPNKLRCLLCKPLTRVALGNFTGWTSL